MEQSQDKVKAAVRQIIDQREEILRAFVAKYECGPEDIVQVMQKEGDNVKFCVRRRDPDEADLGTMEFFFRRQIAGCAAEIRKAALTQNNLKAALAKMRMDAFRESREEMKRRTLKKADTPAVEDADKDDDPKG